jgi:hypothetical protein
MLQGIRNNENNALFYAEYFRFETAFLTKILERREILKGEGQGELKFLDDEEQEDKIDAGTFDTSTKILSIIF